MSTTATAADVRLESFEYHLDSATYRAEYDQEAVSPSLAVIVTLSEVLDIDPLELDSLYASVDPSALDELVGVRGAMNGDISVALTVAEHTITVSSHGTVTIAPPGHDRTDDRHEDAPQR